MTQKTRETRRYDADLPLPAELLALNRYEPAWKHAEDARRDDIRRARERGGGEIRWRRV